MLCISLNMYCLNALSIWPSHLDTCCPDCDNHDSHEDTGGPMECEDCQAPGAQSREDNPDARGEAHGLGEHSLQGGCYGSEDGESWSSPDEEAFGDLLRGEPDTIYMRTPCAECYRKLSMHMIPSWIPQYCKMSTQNMGSFIHKTALAVVHVLWRNPPRVSQFGLQHSQPLNVSSA